MRLTVDIAMFLLMFCQMVPGGTGNAYHEKGGVVLVALFIAHHVLNRGWIGRARRVQAPRQRINFAIDALLAVCICTTAISGALMSRSLVPGLSVASAAHIVRPLHACAAYASLLLVAVHSGIHLRAMTRGAQLGSAAARAMLTVAALGVGIWAFRDLDVATKLTFGLGFPKGDRPFSILLVEHFALALPWAVISHLVWESFRGEDTKHGLDR